jgi:cytochrome P450
MTTSQPALAPVPLSRYPEETLVLGSLRAFTRDGLKFYETCERTAGIVHTRFFVKQVYVITEPAAIEDVLVNYPRAFIKAYVLRRMKVLFGDGLLTAEGDRWLHNRRLVQPAFKSERMPGFIEFVQVNTEKMASSWRSGEVRDVYPELVDLCLHNLARTMFGVFDQELEAIVRELVQVCQRVVHEVATVDWRPSPLIYPSRLKRRLKKALETLDAYLGRLLEQRQREAPRTDFLGLIVSGDGHHPPMSRQQILDESVTMLLAGHETAASALMWCLSLLARHPRHADALAAELAAELKGASPDIPDLDRLDLLRDTLDETLRLYPPTHRIARTVKSPVTVGGHPLKVGAEVVLPQWAVHRSARWYEQPLEFRPDRWTDQFRRDLPKFAYFPFSGGPRACVGSHFVWFESIVILGYLAQHFRFSLPDGAQAPVPYEGLTLVPAGGALKLRIDRRSTPPTSSIRT